ncbi:MAG TPA: peptidylprolyl isomerase [Myxococcales bacterium]|nr:peptidylprolyl isomerase [Myxococcales bacterium]
MLFHARSVAFLGRSSLACLAIAAAAGCRGKAEDKTGPVVATVGNDTITADELRRRFDEVSPFLRGRYNTVERKKEFLENLVRNELLAQEAARRGLDKSPQVREQTKRAMIQELLRQQLDERLSGADIPDDELKKFYDAHLEDFVKPERARAFRILLAADKSDAKARAAAKKQAQALRKEIDEHAKKGDLNAFQAAAMKHSQDKSSASLGGDLRFLSRDELAKTFSPELAAAVFSLKNPGDEAGPLETPQGIELVRLQVRTVAYERKLEEAKDSIRGRMSRERRSREYDEFVRKLRDGGNVKIDEAELAKVSSGAEPTAARGLLQPPASAAVLPPGPTAPPSPPAASRVSDK